MSDDDDDDDTRRDEHIGALWVRVPFYIDDDGDVTIDAANVSLLGREEMSIADFATLPGEYWAETDRENLVDEIEERIDAEIKLMHAGEGKLPFIQT